MENYFAGTILHNWGGVDVLANVEEANEDIVLGIEYEDHGDDFILIKTKDAIYEYGWFLNRPGWPDYSELDKEWCRDRFTRKPSLYLKEDERSSLSNEIFFKVNRGNYCDDIVNKTVVERSKEYAQWKFDKFVKYMNDDVAQRGIMYDKRGDKAEMLMYLEKNDILTEENKVKLDSIKFDTKIDGADGIAGKVSYELDGFTRLYGDSIKRIIYKGKERDPEKIRMKRQWDDWGVDTFDLSLAQFK